MTSQPTLICLPLKQNVRHLTDDIFKCIFLNEKFCILIQITLKVVPNGPTDNKSIFTWKKVRIYVWIV